MAALLTFAGLASCRVAVWGYGREARAALGAMQRRQPQLQPVLLGASEPEARRAHVEWPDLEIHSGPPDVEDLAAFEVIIKSPGIPAYRPEIAAATARGTSFISGTALWFAEHPQARVVGITGTKGKSTTSALLAHLTRSLGVRTALAGNIGLPLLELLDPDDPPQLWVVELSSFQTGECGPLELGLITNLSEEHLDWHGTRERYQADKLRLAKQASTLLLGSSQAELLAATANHPNRVCHSERHGWHIEHEAICYGSRAVLPRQQLSLPGLHNAGNACTALTAVELLGYDAEAAASALADFHGLPHRLQRLGERDGRIWIDDSISTTPEASRAAIESLQGSPLVLILGGHERGLDWSKFASWLTTCPPQSIVLQGANASRIEATLRTHNFNPLRLSNLAAAVETIQRNSPPGNTVLLSPGAPSFDQFHDYAERGQHFATLAGFDTEKQDTIPGLGIA